MLQQNRLLNQWRLGLWIRDLSPYSSNGLLVFRSHLPERVPKNLARLSNCRHLNNCSHNLLVEALRPRQIGCRSYSDQGSRRGLLSKFIENIKQDYNKNKEMKESLKKFKEERIKLEETEILKKVRSKFENVETSAVTTKIGKIKEAMSGAIEEASKTEIAKKAGKISEEFGKSARGAAESISQKGQQLGATETFKTISEATNAVREELETSTSQSRVYVPPAKLRKRLETLDGDAKVYSPDMSTVDLELHKDSRLYESWQNFKNNNAYINKLLDLKLKYEESDNTVIRISRALTDKISDIVGGLFSETALSTTLTEIIKIDPTFTKAKFLRQCETDIIPNIIEAMVRGDLDILKDWCHESVFNVYSVPIKQIMQMGGRLDSKVVDIDNVDLVSGDIIETGPILLITFNSQQIHCVRDRQNKVMEGDPNKVVRMSHVWVLSRDMEVLDPKAAWRLLQMRDISDMV